MGRADFDPRLESLRGLAALLVALHHGMTAFNRETTSSLFVSGFDFLLMVARPEASVMLFFVLSGYVLGRSIERNGDLPTYLIRRAFRILPMFVLSVLFAYVCVTTIRIDAPPVETTAFFQRPFWPTPTTSQLWDNLTFQSSWINGPSWSIYPEIIGSVFLPFLVFLHRRTEACWQWPLFLAVFVLLAFTPYRLVVWFYCGFFLPGQIAKAGVKNWFMLAITLFAGAALLEYAAEHAVYYKFKTILPSAIGATLMIGAIVSSEKFLRSLDVSPLRFLGRVSYSFYLLHWPVFYLCAIAYIWLDLPRGNGGNLSLCFSSIAIALALSALSYKTIELPAMVFSKTILVGKRHTSTNAP